MKKLSLFLCAVLMLACFSGCQKARANLHPPERIAAGLKPGAF